MSRNKVFSVMLIFILTTLVLDSYSYSSGTYSSGSSGRSSGDTILIY